jgi:hypothetical protein
MAAVLDLIMMYSDINQEIMDKKLDSQGVSPAFRLATSQLFKIKDLLKKLPLMSATTGPGQR